MNHKDIAWHHHYFDFCLKSELNIPFRSFLSLGSMTYPVIYSSMSKKRVAAEGPHKCSCADQWWRSFSAGMKYCGQVCNNLGYIPSSASCCSCATQAILGPLKFLSWLCSLVVWKHFRKCSWGCFMRDATLKIVHVYTFTREHENDSFLDSPYIDWKR